MPRSLRYFAALLLAAIVTAAAMPARAAEDGVIRIGMTLRMIVENGIKYGQLTTDELNAVTAYKQFMKDTYQVDPLFSAQQQETDVDFRSNLLKIKSLGPDVLALAGQSDGISRIVTQALEVGIPRKVARVSASAASNAPVPETAGDAVVGLIFSAAFVCTDPRPEAQAFVKMVQEKYQVRCPDHDWAQAYETAQIVKAALAKAKLTLTDASLADDRKAIRDALAGIRDFQGVVPGKINFCADPTPQCRDGNRTPILVQYTKGGKD